MLYESNLRTVENPMGRKKKFVEMKLSFEILSF